MKLFTLGPVEMYPNTLEAASKQLPYFRTDDFSKVNLENASLIKNAAGAASDSEVIFLTASGTAAMEAAVMNSFDASDKLLVINGGGFGRRFAEICGYHEIPHEAIELSFGEALTQEHLKAYDGKGFTGLLVNIHETTTGQLYDMNMLSDFCRRNNLLFVVDAISSFLADSLYMEKSGIDALIISSQKALALSPGLSIVLLSKKIYENRVAHKRPQAMYFDFKDYVLNGKRGQTPFTPAVGILLELNERLRQISKEGASDLISETKALATHFRKGIENLPIGIPAYPLSNACTPILFERGDAKEVYTALANRGLYLNPNGGELASTVLRVGHIGNLTISDNDSLITALREVTE